jgi:hypothetical protein
MDTTGRFWMQRELKRSLETKFDRIYGKCEVELNTGAKIARMDSLESFGRDYVRRVGDGSLSQPDVAASDEGRALKLMVC